MGHMYIKKGIIHETYMYTYEEDSRINNSIRFQPPTNTGNKNFKKTNTGIKKWLVVLLIGTLRRTLSSYLLRPGEMHHLG
jgi:hypothetical protein